MGYTENSYFSLFNSAGLSFVLFTEVAMAYERN